MTTNPQPLPQREPGSTFNTHKPPATITQQRTEPRAQCTCPDGRITTKDSTR